MAKANTSVDATVDTVNESQVVGYDASQFEWETVHFESPDQIVFDNIGDVFIAEYVGRQTIHYKTIEKGEEVDNSFVQLQFRLSDKAFVVNAGWDLLAAFTNQEREIPVNTVVRIALLAMVDVGKQSPMKSYRVDVAKPVAKPVDANS